MMQLLQQVTVCYTMSMTPKLPSDLQQAVQKNHGFTEAEADGAKFVVMSQEFYRDMMGVGSDDELQDSLRAIDNGITDIEAGRTKPAVKFFAEFDKQHGLSR
jgi:hypothetical protein